MNRNTQKGLFVLAMVVVPAASALAQTAYGLTPGNTLVEFNVNAPGVITNSAAIGGLMANESVCGIDFRPKTLELYGFTNMSRLVKINPITGMATGVGPGFTPALTGSEYGFDFNPLVDRIRLVSDSDQNYRLHPDTGLTVANDGTITYAAGDLNAGKNPNVVGSAYTNNLHGTASTTLYNIDSMLGILTTQIPPNNGVLNTVGPLGLVFSDMVGFDIYSYAGMNWAYASLQMAGSAGSGLYSINLMNGAATFIGNFGAAAPLLLRDLAITPVPEPASMAALGLGVLALILKRKRA